MKKYITYSLFFVFFIGIYACSSKKSEKYIDVMSYNIHIATPGSETDFNITDLPAVAEVINREEPNIVFLQEVDQFTNRSGKDSDQAKDLGEATNMDYHFAGASYKSDGQQGQAILSKHPIKHSETHKLYLPEKSKGETRSLAVSIIEIDGVDVALMTVHLDHKTDENREYQITQMLEATSEFNHYPIILGGDFNMKPDNKNFMIIKSQFKMLSDEHPLTFPQINPRVTIDYIMMNDKALDMFELVDYYTVDEQYASDHLPLVARLKIK